ncbi:MAG: CDP-glycerol glycerophosphotransferase family protein [Treponema sp.]|nr:CDP-glycerol glycerophosphotransferase family protein [Treponema sp.]
MNTFLYIDPGTGSMLFSIIIAAVATISFGARALWIKLRVTLSGKKNKDIKTATEKKPYIIFNEGNQYWNVFKPVCDQFEKRKIELIYYTSSKTDPVFEQNYEYVKPSFIGEGNVAFAKLNMISADFVLMTTPGLQVYQLKRSKHVKHYAHVLHMPNDATTYRLFGLDFFDSVLLTGDYQKEDIQFLETQRGINKKDLVTVGCTYLDVYKENISKIPAEENHPFTVLVSPSWGDVGILKKYGEKLLDPLSQTGWRIIIRPHPQSKKSEADMLARLEERYKDNKNIEWDYERQNIFSLKKADVMISDFSGIIFDYTFLCDKPVMYVKSNMDLRPYDAYDLGEKKLWQYSALKTFGTELQEEQFANIKEVIHSMSDSKELEAARHQAKATAWMHEGQAGKNIADYMIATVEKLNKTE